MVSTSFINLKAKGYSAQTFIDDIKALIHL